MEHRRRMIGVAARLLLIGSMAGACATTSGPTAAGRKTEGSPPALERELPIPADLAPHVREAEMLGVEIYFLDKASAIGTDVLRAQVPDVERKTLSGWITVREGDGEGRLKDSYAVMFVTNESPPRMAYTIHVPLRGKPTLETFSPPKPASDGLVLMYRARQSAKAAVPRGRRALNPVVLPGELVGRPGKILVYLLTGEVRVGEMVFGVHYRVLVSADGGTVEEVLPLSKSELIVGPPTNLPPGAKEVEVMVSHIVTDWPIETHVFVSMLHNHEPVLVATRRGLWRVKGPKISLLSENVPGAAKPAP